MVLLFVRVATYTRVRFVGDADSLRARHPQISNTCGHVPEMLLLLSLLLFMMEQVVVVEAALLVREVVLAPLPLKDTSSPNSFLHYSNPPPTMVKLYFFALRLSTFQF